MCAPPAERTGRSVSRNRTCKVLGRAWCYFGWQQSCSSYKLGVVDPTTASSAVSKAFAKLPVINVFRAMANAETLYPAFIDFLSLLFQRSLEIDPALLRVIVLRVASLAECFYAWRQNVVVARRLGVTEEQIDALERGDIVARCFSPAEQAAFVFTDEVVFMVEATDATYGRAKDHFSDRALTEILYAIGTYVFIARVIRTGRVPAGRQARTVSRVGYRIPDLVIQSYPISGGIVGPFKKKLNRCPALIHQRHVYR